MGTPLTDRSKNLWNMFMKMMYRIKRASLYVWYFLAVVGVGVSLAVIGVFAWATRVELPSVDGFKDRPVSQSTKIFDRTGKVLLFNVHNEVQRTIVPFEDISRHLKNATVAIEDTEFYQHKGIKPTAILRAVYANIISGSYSQGGSTITQQVVKNTLLTGEKTISRKLKEWILSLTLERRLTKDEILSIYLNEMPYGGNIYGVEEASKRFFGKTSAEVTLAEAAYIAALPQAPTYYSPFGEHLTELADRKNLVLKRMREEGFITDEEYATAKEEVVAFLPFSEKNIKAPHFVFYVREFLEQKYGTDAVYNGGLSVITTIDWRLQSAGEEIIKKFALKNETDFNAENAALVAIDPKTGQILAMVGSRDYFDEKIDGKYNIATALRQPGSTFKPIAYTAAFEKGFTPETVVFDVPTQFSVNCPKEEFETKENCYSPQNYDDKFRGPMTLRNALAQSINIPAVKVLYLAGLQNVINTAKSLGITTLTQNANHYGFSLVLGGGEVSLLELTGAYATIANQGVRNPIVGVLEIKDAQGTVISKFEPKEIRAVDSQAARLTTDVLSDNAARAPSYGVRSFLNFGDIDVAGKTGTTNDYRDVWVVGYTPTIAVGTWAGNNDNTPIVHKVAGYVIAPMWRAYMNEALKYVAHEKFERPDPIPYDTLQPVLNGDWSNGNKGAHSILMYVSKDNPRGPAPANPNADQQFGHWEYGVQAWVAQNGLATPDGAEPGSEAAQAALIIQPTGAGASQSTQQHSFAIVNPARGASIKVGQPLTITVRHTGPQPLEKVEYHVNGVFMGASNSEPFSITVVPDSGPEVTIRAIGHAKFSGGVFSDVVTVPTQ